MALVYDEPISIKSISEITELIRPPEPKYY